MANSFMKKNSFQHKNYELQYKTSRMNLLLVVIFTAINLLLLIANADTYFLFSAFIPYFITTLGMLMCGRFPAEFYTDELEGMVFLDDSFFVVLLVIALALTLLYLLAWFKSRKQRVGWLIFALVFFSIDTLGMLLLNGISFDSIFDILFHAWVIYYLALGIGAHNMLKKTPPAEETVLLNDNTDCENISYEDMSYGAEENEDTPEPDVAQTTDSPVLRNADKNVKHRILLEKHIFNYDICYRRVKNTNELVVNGKVYDEIKAVIEPNHSLDAFIDGHRISVGYNGTHSFIEFDGDLIAKKVRLY